MAVIWVVETAVGWVGLMALVVAHEEAMKVVEVRWAEGSWG